MADLRELIEGAAAKPTQDAPLSTIETRLRRRRSRRRGVVGLVAIGLVASIGGGIALSTDDGPSVRTAAAAGETVAASTEPSVTVTLPEGWVESPIEAPFRFDQEILTVGTALQPTGAAHHVCQEAPEFHDDVFVQLQEFTHVIVLNEAIGGTPVGAYGASDEFLPRPGDFSIATPNQELSCVTNDPTMSWRGIGFSFDDQGRLFNATIGFGPASAPERQAEAYAVLNSLVVEPFTDIPLPTTTTPSTIPPSADSEAITAAFEGWVAAAPPEFTGAEAFVEDWTSIVETARRAAEDVGNPQCYTGRVDAITRIDEDDADVIFSFFCDGRPAVPSQQQGRAVKIDGVWMVSRDTVCEAFAIGQQRCPPREASGG